MEPDNTAELVFFETVQVLKVPESISQAENAGSILVIRSRRSPSSEAMEMPSETGRRAYNVAAVPICA